MPTPHLSNPTHPGLADYEVSAHSTDNLLPSEFHPNFCQMIEALVHITTQTRPDILYATSQLLLASDTTTYPLQRYARHVLIYLWQTRFDALSSSSLKGNIKGYSAAISLTDALTKPITLLMNEPQHSPNAATPRHRSSFSSPNST